MSFKTSENGISLIKGFEALRLEAYQDAVGVWTIGYGWTGNVEDIPVHSGMIISDDTAEILLRSGLLQYERAINQLVTTTLDQNQFDALVSLAYNIGLGGLLSVPLF